MIKGVILDFNGTLYRDHDINQAAWEYAFNSVRPTNSNEKYKDWKRPYVPYDNLLSKMIYEHFNIRADDNMINQLSESKEIEYRRLATSMNKNSLIKGADVLLDYLKGHGVPYFIASMAPKSDFDFYLDYLHLDKWFTYDNIIYDDGNYSDKLSQVRESAKRMGVSLKDCLVIEDTPNNIMQIAKEEKDIKFIYINTRNKAYITKEIIQEIKDFTEIDYKIFNN